MGVLNGGDRSAKLLESVLLSSRGIGIAIKSPVLSLSLSSPMGSGQDRVPPTSLLTFRKGLGFFTVTPSKDFMEGVAGLQQFSTMVTEILHILIAEYARLQPSSLLHNLQHYPAYYDKFWD